MRPSCPVVFLRVGHWAKDRVDVLCVHHLAPAPCPRCDRELRPACPVLDLLGSIRPQYSIPPSGVPVVFLMGASVAQDCQPFIGGRIREDTQPGYPLEHLRIVLSELSTGEKTRSLRPFSGSARGKGRGILHPDPFLSLVRCKVFY
jgi:hypothetical protein